MDKVLLIDDEVDICLLLSGILQREGFHTTYALSIGEAKQKLAGQGFGAVFVDLNLPDGVGYKLIPLIKEGNKDAKVIVVSAYDGEKNKAEDEGADYFIAKPFTRSVVLSALEELDLYHLPNE